MSERKPDINRIFDVSPLEAEELWLSGQSMPPATGRHDEYFMDRIRRSENGLWVVRLNRPHDARQTGQIIQKEYTRLQGHEMKHLSFGNVALSPRRLITITPWADGLSECTDTEYNVSIKPKLADYYAEVAEMGNQPYLSTEIADPEQYSMHTILDEPFLRDIGPMLHQGPALARHMARYLLTREF